MKKAHERKGKFAAALALALSAVLLLAGCHGAGKQKAAPVEGFYSFTDSLGRSITLASRPQRVAVISASYADTWMLAGGTLYATTQDAWEEGTLSLPGNVLDLGSVKTPSVEAMVEHGIDFVILSSKIEEHVKLLAQLEELHIPCAYFEVEVFSDYLRMLKICTDITGKTDLYRQNGTEVQAQIDAAVARKEGKKAPTVLFIRAYSTGANAKNSDNMTGAMLKELGCVNIADSDGALLENLSMETVMEKNPDFIFFVTMGASEEKALASMQTALEENPAFYSLSAVRNNRYIQLPKALFHLKPNRRWGESYEFLADILYQ